MHPWPHPTDDTVLASALERLVSVTAGTIAAVLCVTLLLPARSRDQPEAGTAASQVLVHASTRACVRCVLHACMHALACAHVRSCVRACTFFS